jgi:hypothetical protein
MKLLFVLMLMLLADNSIASVIPKSIADAAIFQPREDGSIDVVCTNGNREKIALLDLVSNRVCPSMNGSVTTGMQLVMPRTDGNFDVTCRDFSRLIATQQQILAGEICIPTIVPAIESGNYRVAEGFWGYFDQSIVVSFEGEVLKSIKIQIPQLSLQADLACTEAVCNGKWTYGGMVHLEVKATNAYSYSQVDSQGNLIRTALFKKY